MDTKKKLKLRTKIAIGIGSLIIAIFISLLIIQLAVKIPEGVDPSEYTIIQKIADWSRSCWDLKKAGDNFVAHLGTIITSLVWITVIIAVSTVIRLIFKTRQAKNQKVRTVITLIDGFIKYGSAIAIILLILNAFGVDTKALWASAGILALIIGLGAQPLIADIIAGIFIIFEDEFHAGEIVCVDDFRGTVSEIGIRATRIKDAAGNIKIINNSDIKNIVNLSRELSIAAVNCQFPYFVPIETIEALFNDHLKEIKEKIPGIIEGPFYKGVCDYGSSNVSVKLIAKCKEENRFQVERDLLREYRKLFNANGIDLSYDQVVINEAKDTNFIATIKQKEKAEEFNKKQKEVSHGLEEQMGSKK